MTETAPHPILFLDVDGPLNPFASRPETPPGYELHYMRPDIWADPDLLPLPVYLNPEHGEQLLRLPAELIWATTWEHDANEWIGPRIGLPELPVVEWPEDLNSTAPVGLCWKTPSLLEVAEGRPFAFVDDDITDADQAWAAERHPAPVLFRRIDPAVGLTAEDFVALGAWLRAQTPGAA